jgi:tetratricopeptide (TPR) repeat protein
MKHPDRVVSVAFSPDGKTILTGGDDRTAQLWEAATGRPLGPPLEHPSAVASVAFSPDARWILTVCWDNMARLWDAATGLPVGPVLSGALWPRGSFSPDGRFLLTATRDGARLRELPLPLPDDLPRLSAWVKAVTGAELTERGSIRVLDRAAWQENRRRLEALGGPPPADPAPRFDPILFGDEPEARGDAWKEKGLWDRAEAAYSEAIQAHPVNGSLWDTVARFLIDRGHPDRAGATLEEAFRLMPEDFELGWHLSLIRLWIGDHADWRKLIGELFDRFGRTNNYLRANQLAWVCSLGPDGVADPQAPVRLTELALRIERSSSGRNTANILNTLAAALYRAGQYEEATRRLEQEVQARGGAVVPDDWPLLAMAHHRLGHHNQARQWLARLREHEPSTDPRRFWQELVIRLLFREAEGLILYDPIFPADPFAR